MLSERCAITEHVPTLVGVNTPVSGFTVQEPELTEYDTSPLPDPPTATNWRVVLNRTVAELVNVMVLCDALSMTIDAVVVPWKFASTTVAVTEYVPAFVGAHAD